MAGASRRGDVLFAVGALSDGLFNDGDDLRAYAQVIEDYFVDSEMDTEPDNECSMQLFITLKLKIL